MKPKMTYVEFRFDDGTTQQITGAEERLRPRRVHARDRMETRCRRGEVGSLNA
jgi:hypothetical protein